MNFCGKRLLGRIIFAELLEYPLEKYRRFIEKTKSSLLSERLEVGFKKLSRARISDNAKGASLNVVAEIARSGSRFTIKYTYEGFNTLYVITQNDRLFYRLRRINSRNTLTHSILMGIIEHQERYLNTGNPVDLLPFTQVKLAFSLSRTNGEKGRHLKFPSPCVCNTWVCRLVNRLSVIIPSGEEKTLDLFFPTHRDSSKRFIKRLLDRENGDIESGRLIKPLTDNQIRTKLKSEYGVGLSRHSIGLCRKVMGIPPSKRRLSGYKYPPLSANFSVLYPLTVESVQGNASASPGIYEFRLKGEEADYPNGKSNTIYMGSAKNIKKRLIEHLRPNNKNGRIRDFLTKFQCCFRYIVFKKDWRQEEKKLYRLFTDTYGAPPKCNRVKP